MTTVDRPANKPAQRLAKRAHITQHRRPRAKPGDDRVVIIDIDGLGYTIVYSTTRPRYTRDPSGLWLITKDFPTGKAMFTRPKSPAGLHPQPAWQTKLSHAKAVTH